VKDTNTRYEKHEHTIQSRLNFSNSLLKADLVLSSSVNLKDVCALTCHVLSCSKPHISDQD
jgi:hypothetical protein